MNIKKTIIFLIGIFCALHILAQPPQKMSYQAVVRDANNQLIVNQQVGVKISILEASPNGFPVFAERHQATTNANGLISLEIGTGVPLPTNNLTTIDWGNNNFYLQCEIDITGGTQYSINGVQQLITVPYAFFAETSAYADSADFNNLANRPIGNQNGDILYWNNTTETWDILPIGQQGQILTVNNGALTWVTSSVLTTLPPTIRTDSVYNITGRTANVRATIIDAGSTGIISSGVCWSTTPFPSIGNNHTTDGTSIGTFVSTINGLTSGTLFYARAYATNSVGTSYGQPISFTTPTHCGTVTDYDGNTYQTIYIGAQCWMKENLKTTHYSNGAVIPEGGNGSSGKYYFKYDHNDANKAKYGLLYTWEAVMNGAGSSNNNPSGIQGICPSGWHVPSTSEWCELENYVEPGIDVTCSSTGFRGSMAKKLAKPELWATYTQNSFAPGYWSIDTTGFDESGFSALPAGRYYYYSSYFLYLNYNAYFWSCSTTSGGSVYYRYMDYSESGVGMNTTSSPNVYAYSVRCVKN